MGTDAVILAGGYSSRANAFKMELKLEGKPVLQHVIDAFIPICTHIVVVGGYQIERIYPLVPKYEDKVTVVYNTDYSSGMFSSVKKGIGEVTGSRFFLTPGDCPLLSTDTCRQLLEYGGQIVKPVCRGKGGHPVLLSCECIKEILAEPDESNLKIYLAKKQVIQIETEDEGILLDVDTPVDFEKAERLIRLNSRNNSKNREL